MARVFAGEGAKDFIEGQGLAGGTKIPLDGLIVDDSTKTLFVPETDPKPLVVVDDKGVVWPADPKSFEHIYFDKVSYFIKIASCS